MHREVLVIEITKIDCTSAVLRELVGGGAANADGGVASRDDGDAGLKPPVRQSAEWSIREKEGKSDGRATRVGRYAADLGDVLEGAGVGGGDDELLAEGLEAAFWGGGHG